MTSKARKTNFMTKEQRETLARLIPNSPAERGLIVHRGSLPEELRAFIVPSDTVKLLVAGQRGMGKTTELRRLAEMLAADPEEDFIAVFSQFGAQDNITDAALLRHMVRALAAHEEANVPKGLLETFEGWYADETISNSIEEGGEGQAGLGGEFVFFKAQAGVKHARSRKQTKKQTVLKSKLDLLKLFNEMIDKTAKKTKKRVVFVIDDIDKVQNEESIHSTFVQSAQLISDIACPCVFTIPLTYATSEYVRMALPYHRIHRVAALDLLNQDGSRNEEAFSFMREVFKRRMSFNPLSCEQMDKVLLYSGGVLVDAMRMLGTICSRIIASGTSGADDDVVEEAFQQLVDDFMVVFDNADLWLKLAMFCEADDKRLFNIEPSKLDLLSRMVLIEYRNKYVWFDLHPAARRLYEQNRSVIKESSKRSHAGE